MAEKFAPRTASGWQPPPRSNTKGCSHSPADKIKPTLVGLDSLVVLKKVLYLWWFKMQNKLGLNLFAHFKRFLKAISF
jgi:hypothetical protein